MLGPGWMPLLLVCQFFPNLDLPLEVEMDVPFAEENPVAMDVEFPVPAAPQIPAALVPAVAIVHADAEPRAEIINQAVAEGVEEQRILRPRRNRPRAAAPRQDPVPPPPTAPTLTCSICLDRPVDKVMLPCGHCFCRFCAIVIDHCGLFRRFIDRKVSIYL